MRSNGLTLTLGRTNANAVFVRFMTTPVGQEHFLYDKR